MMKKFTFLFVATCFAISSFAQGIVTPVTPKSEATFSLAKKGTPAQSPKENTVYFTSQFNGGCADLDSAKYYYFTDDQGNYAGQVTGTNAYNDEGFAQQFHFSSNISVVGVAAFLINYNPGDDETLKAFALNSSFNELAYKNYQISSLSEEGSLNQYIFTSPINVQDVIVGVTVNLYTASTSSIIALATSLNGCSSGLTRYCLNSGTWADMATGVPNFNADFFVFPITSGTVSIADLDQLTSIYPNPTNEQVTVMSSVKINTVEIFNVMGQMVYSANVNDNATTINVSDFATGAYIVKMNTESGSINKKLMVK